ncbi:MAG: protein phosphatase 2C domain-containing protein [Myxococcota bacterium]
MRAIDFTGHPAAAPRPCASGGIGRRADSKSGGGDSRGRFRARPSARTLHSLAAPPSDIPPQGRARRSDRPLRRAHRGPSRSTNEDSYLVDQAELVMCDGLGRHLGGEIASATAVNVVREGIIAKKDVVEAYEFDDGRFDAGAVERMLRDVVTLANQRIRERAAQTQGTRGMGTTLSLLLLAGSTAFIAHVGDTRVYRLRGGTLEQLTEDHSLANELARDGVLEVPAPAVMAALRNQVTRAVGVNETVECDVATVKILPGDRFMLASDGLHGLVPPDELGALAAIDEVGDAAARLVDRANERGGKDNITVIVVQVEKRADDLEEERRVWPLFEAVRGSAFFAGLSDAELGSLLEACQQLALMPKDVLVAEGRPVPGFYLVADGEAQVMRGNEHVALLRTGDFFGEDALLGERASFATILGSGEGPASIVLLDRVLFEELSHTSPMVALKIALAVGRSLARKVQGALREASHPRLMFKDPGALSRPMPRPSPNTRVLADTEPQGHGPAHMPPQAPASSVLQRPRTAERRVYPVPTQPEMPAYRDEPVPPPLPFALQAPPLRDTEDS